MNTQLDVLNCLRADFKRWAVSNEPSTWELNVNKIDKNLSAFGASRGTCNTIRLHRKRRRLVPLCEYQ